MHLIIPVFLQLLLSPLFFSDTVPPTEFVVSESVVIEVLNEKEIPFEFSVKYEQRRDQIHFRSEKAIQSLKIIKEDKSEKAYDVRGSNLIMLPRVDLSGGSYIGELTFQKDPIVVQVKMDIPLKLSPSDL